MVAQTCCLLYRRLAACYARRVCERLEFPGAWQRAALRYSGLQVCATEGMEARVASRSWMGTLKRGHRAAEFGVHALGRIFHNAIVRARAALINTPLQRGVRCQPDHRNRFNGFSRHVQTVETVWDGSRISNTPLKRGVNETERRRRLRCYETFGLACFPLNSKTGRHEATPDI